MMVPPGLTLPFYMNIAIPANRHITFHTICDQYVIQCFNIDIGGVFFFLGDAIFLLCYSTNIKNSNITYIPYHSPTQVYLTCLRFLCTICIFFASSSSHHIIIIITPPSSSSAPLLSFSQKNSILYTLHYLTLPRITFVYFSTWSFSSSSSSWLF